MIAFLTGRIAAKGTAHALLDVGGVGYRLNMSTASLAALPREGDQATVHTYLHVREDELTLYGFGDEAEKAAFEQLITVSGVGPKVALATLSAITPDALARAVADEDVALISSVPGIGKKTAQRIVVDLTDRMSAVDGLGGTAGKRPAGAPDIVGEVREALQSMGFSTAEVAAAMKGAPADGDAQRTLQWALRRLGGGR